ncbi:MAG: 23S rRNA (uracil-C(5))-methyltransferase RlmCD [Chlamydiales bacterium]|nr:23S rRNA (uracil-C(5))-methyltransferase RlmCD [Chlamydiales bacterium]MCH9620303.1 23S rRNA (uracil-C(5))-methyltransferase RlmCD [Chlamydiales bacterium]MCH9622786.1 23S rRNA (uracil-C(5))-methyltransferase RlmCD [Chlamydiales bacterium]
MKITVHSLGSSGEGIGTLPDGLKVFIEGALPGEEVEISLIERKKNYGKGKLITLLSPSPSRQKPICPLFGRCGGCHIMHLNYKAQLAIKRQKVVDALERIGQIKHPPVAETLPSPMPLHYRNKIQLPVTHDLIGLYQKRSHTIIDVPKCYIHCEPGEIIYKWCRKHLPRTGVRTLYIRSALFNEETVVIIVTDGSNDLLPFAQQLMGKYPRVVGVVENINRSNTNVILGKRYHTLAGRPHFFEKICGKTFKITPPSFFQVNPWQAEVLFQKAIELASIQPEETVLDAYTGVGTLALFAADFAKEVIGIETVPSAIESACENAKLNRVTNCHFKVGEAKAENVDITLLNPPRKGCDQSLLKEIKSPKLIYISCDPATLARDLKKLDHYRVESVQPIDLFPQTTHVETIVKLIKS